MDPAGQDPTLRDRVQALLAWHAYRAVAPHVAGRRVLVLDDPTVAGAAVLAAAPAAHVLALSTTPVRETAPPHPTPPGVRRLAGTWDAWPLPPQSVDVIVACSLLQQVPSARWAAALATLRATLAPGGWCVLAGAPAVPAAAEAIATVFPYVTAYHLMLTAATVCWPATDPTPAQMARLPAALPIPAPSTPEPPVAQTLFVAAADRVPITLTTVAWDPTGQGLAGGLAAVARARHDQAVAQAALAECQQTLAATIRDAHRLAAEVDRLTAALMAIETSRSWRWLKRYWHFLDHHPLGRAWRRLQRRSPNGGAGR